jgi:hypothetical protein
MLGGKIRKEMRIENGDFGFEVLDYSCRILDAYTHSILLR